MSRIKLNYNPLMIKIFFVSLALSVVSIGFKYALFDPMPLTQLMPVMAFLLIFEWISAWWISELVAESRYKRRRR